MARYLLPPSTLTTAKGGDYVPGAYDQFIAPRRGKKIDVSLDTVRNHRPQDGERILECFNTTKKDEEERKETTGED